MAIEPTREEVIRWRRRLENRDFDRRTLAFQQYIYDVFEKRRRTTGLMIRTVIARHDVKGLESLVDKIRRKRLKDPAYNFRHVKDFVGIKVVCPHPSSVDKVITWMYEQRQLFTVTPRRKKDARQRPEGEEEGGYYGYQFFAQPVVTKYPDWIGLSCEIQVKTMLEEAWDAMTHETLYKREESVHPAIRELARNLSKHLQPCDKDGEEINRLIQEEEQQDAAFRRAAAFVFLSDPFPSLKRLITKYKLPVIQSPPGLTQKVLKKYNETVDKLYQKGISREVCWLSAIVAVCHPEPEQRAMTLSLANELGEERGDDPVIEDIRAGVYWALGDFDQAIACGEAAVVKAVSLKKPSGQIDGLQAELCYWIGEAVRAGKAINKRIRDEALKQAKDLCRRYPNSFPWRDTLGFLKIVFAETSEQVREGLDDVEKAYELGKAAKGIRRLVKEFYKRHKRLGEIKLGKLAKLH